MTDTLSTLSSKLFIDVQANHADTMRRLDQLERERHARLEALPGSAPVLKGYRADAEEAEATKVETLQDIDAQQRAAERQAAERRGRDLADVEQRFRDADEDARSDGLAADRNAREAFDGELAKIGVGRLDPAQKVLARADARRRLEAELEANRAALSVALESNWHAYHAGVMAATRKELDEARKARDTASAKRTETELLFQRALKAADVRMQTGLGQVAGAEEVQTAFDRDRESIKQASRLREADLFAAFRAAKAELGA